jgi:hypothetical protein
VDCVVEDNSYEKDLKLLEQRRNLVFSKVKLFLLIVLVILVLHYTRLLTLQDLWLGITKIPELLSDGIISLGRLLGSSLV